MFCWRLQLKHWISKWKPLVASRTVNKLSVCAWITRFNYIAYLYCLFLIGVSGAAGESVWWQEQTLIVCSWESCSIQPKQGALSQYSHNYCTYQLLLRGSNRCTCTSREVGLKLKRLFFFFLNVCVRPARGKKRAATCTHWLEKSNLQYYSYLYGSDVLVISLRLWFRMKWTKRDMNHELSSSLPLA